MSFVMHELVYFGRSIPWMVIDCIPHFNRYKIQNVGSSRTLHITLQAKAHTAKNPHHSGAMELCQACSALSFHGGIATNMVCKIQQPTPSKRMLMLTGCSIQRLNTWACPPVYRSRQFSPWPIRSQYSLCWRIRGTIGRIELFTGVHFTRTSIKSTTNILRRLVLRQSTRLRSKS